MDSFHLTEREMRSGNFLTMREASEYVSEHFRPMTVSGLNTHLYRAKTKYLTLYHGDVYGRVRRFLKKTELDTFGVQNTMGWKAGRDRTEKEGQRVVILKRKNALLHLRYELIREKESDTPYVLHCIGHDRFGSAATQRKGIASLAEPWEWCGRCRLLKDSLE